jgi:glutamate-1-semialdehyde 2,1-aminomutase
MGSLFRLHLRTTPIIDYRSSYPTAAEKQALTRIHLGLLERGYLLTPNCSGALSTPMTESHTRDLATAIVEATTEIHRQTPWN